MRTSASNDVQNAIDTSVWENRTVTVEATDAHQEQLLIECEGVADEDDGRHYWGVNSEGSEWSILAVQT